MHLRFLIIFTLLFFAKISVFGQKIMNQTFNDQIQTVRLFPSTNEVALPILNLNSGEELNFLFDELVEDSKTYYYTIEAINENGVSGKLPVMKVE